MALDWNKTELETFGKVWRCGRCNAWDRQLEGCRPGYYICTECDYHGWCEGDDSGFNFAKLVPEAVIPTYASDEAAGMDISSIEETTIQPGEWKLVATGIAAEIEPGHELQVRPRSGLALKHGLTVLNSPGTVDSDYRGEIKVMLINHGKSAYMIKPGDRIAQLVLAVVATKTTARFGEKKPELLRQTKRGGSGFGSSGR